MKNTGVARKAWIGMAASETGSAAWPGRLSGVDHRLGHRRYAIVVADMVGVGVFTSLGFQVKGIPRLFDPAAMDRRRHRRAVRVFPTANSAPCFRARAGNTISSVAPFTRRSDFWRLGVGDVGFAAPVALAAMAFGEYGKAVSGRATVALAIGVSGCVDCSTRRRQALEHFQLISTILKVVLIVAFLIAGFVIGTPQPCRSRRRLPISHTSPARRSGSDWCS